MKHFINNLKSLTWPQRIFLLGIFSIFIVNSVRLWPEMSRIHSYYKLGYIQHIGHRFSGLKEQLKDAQTIGFYSDLDLNDTEGSKLLSQAQYRLAPIIVDYKNLNHPYVMFICSKPEVAFKKLNEMNLQPFISNKYGVIIGKRL